MGVTVIPAPAGGGIKSVQRGLAGASGTVTITAVDTSKSFVTVFGTTSTGAAAVSATVGSQSGSMNKKNTGGGSSGQTGAGDATFSLGGASLSGGTTTLVSAVIQGYLSNSTSLVVSGPCRWEVVEFV
jgi:hypothetical protein